MFKDILLSENSDDSERDITEADLHDMLQAHVRRKKAEKSFSLDMSRFQEEYSFYGSSLILEHDKYHDRQKKRNKNDKHFPDKKPRTDSKKIEADAQERRHKVLEAKLEKQLIQREKDMNYKRRKLWNVIVKKEIPKVCCFSLCCNNFNTTYRTNFKTLFLVETRN